jgi:hypothetical protein
LIPLVGYGESSKKQFYFFGGGGEPKGETTIFDNDVKRLGKFTSNSDWETTVSFNGGHKKTEEIIKSKMGNARDGGAFTEKNYNNLINEMILRLESGELKKGDQLMIAINTHGAKNYGGNGAEKTHRVALSYGEATNLSNLSGAQVVNLDRLERLIELASKSEVKLAIADLSCFSGNLLNIKNDKVCLISGTGTNHYGFGSGHIAIGSIKIKVSDSFANKFFGSFKKGKNLEDLFLNARAETEANDFPMISSPEGLELNNLIYKMISPYLYYNSSNTSDFGSNYERTGTKFEEQVCRIEKNHNQFQALLKHYDALGKVNDELIKNEFVELRNSLEEYRNYQILYEQSLRGKFEVESEIIQVLKKNFPNDQKIWRDYNVLDFLTADYDHSIKHYQDLAKAANSKVVAEMWNKNVIHLKKQKEIAEFTKSNLSTDSLRKLKEQEEAYQKSGVTYQLALKVSAQARKVYQTLYRNIKRPATNPCRDFVL